MKETSSATGGFVAQPNGPARPTSEFVLGANESKGTFSHPTTTASLTETAESSSQSYPIILGS